MRARPRSDLQHGEGQIVERALGTVNLGGRSTRALPSPIFWRTMQLWQRARSTIFCALATVLTLVRAGVAAPTPQQPGPTDAPEDTGAPADSRNRARAPSLPVVTRLDLVGNEALSEGDLRKLLSTRVGQPLHRPGLKEDLRALEMAYADDGFLLAQVDVSIDEPIAGRAVVRFSIVEGQRVGIDRVHVVRIGASHTEESAAISDAEIQQVLSLEPARLGGLLERGAYRPHAVQAGLQQLRQLYRSRGWLDAEVGLGGVETDASKRWVTVEVIVEEGRRYPFGEPVLEGAGLFPAELLLGELDIEPGEPYSGEAVESARRALVRWYQERSDRIPTVRATIRYTESDEIVPVFQIDESLHRYVGRVEISGNQTTQDRVIRQHARVEPGEPLTLIELDRTAERLRALGIFETVAVQTRERADDPTTHDVLIDVVEKERLLRWQLGGGAASGQGEIGYLLLEHPDLDIFRLPSDWSDWSDAFTGGGQRLSLEVVPGNRESLYRLAFLEPYLFSSDRTLSLEVGTTQFDYGSYDEKRLQARMVVRQFLDEDHRLSAALGYHFEEVEIDDVDGSTPATVLLDRGHRNLAYPRLSLGWSDLTHDAYSGPAGIFAEARLDFADSALGSSADFTRVELEGDGFLKLFDDDPIRAHRLHLGISGGWMAPHENDRIPFYELFASGGPDSIRGFRYRGVGPHEGHTAVGGAAWLEGTVEYSMPLFLPEVRGVASFDWGAVEEDFGDLSGGRLRTAAGLGLELRFPLFGEVVPVNLYWTQALSSEEGDREQVFTFTLGYRLR